MTNKNPARKSRFTPRAKTAQTTNERRYPLSLLLAGASAVLTLAVASWLGLLTNGKNVSLEITEVKRAESGDVQLTGARYRGLTPAGKPYEITASKANEASDGSGRVDLDQPTAVLIMRNGSPVNLQSNSGVFNKDTDTVSMLGAVVVTQPDRNLRLDTEVLEANLKAGEMRSDVAVHVQDIDRRINADSMRAYDNGARIVFGGAAKMIIKNNNSIAPTSEALVKPKTNRTKI